MLVFIWSLIAVAMWANGELLLNESFQEKFNDRARALVTLEPRLDQDVGGLQRVRVAVYVVGFLRNFRQSAIPYWDDRIFSEPRNKKKYRFDIYVCTTLAGTSDEKRRMRQDVKSVYEDAASGRYVRSIIDTGDLQTHASQGTFPERLFLGTTCLRPTSYMFIRLKYADYARRLFEQTHKDVSYGLAMYLRPDVIPDRGFKLDLFTHTDRTLYFLLGTVRFRCFAEDRDYDLGYVGSPRVLSIMMDNWAFHSCVSGMDLRKYILGMPSDFSRVCPKNEPGLCYPKLPTGSMDPRLVNGVQPKGLLTTKDGKLLPQDFEGSLGLHEIPVTDEVHRTELGVWLAPFIRAYEQGVHLDTALSKRRWYFLKINRAAYYQDYGDNRLPPGECLCCKVKWFTHGAVFDPYVQPIAYATG